MERAVLTGTTLQPDAGPARKDRRLRAAYRRELRESVYFSAIVVTVSIMVGIAAWAVAVPAMALPLVGLTLPLMLTGAQIMRSVRGPGRGRGRRKVVQLGMVVGLLPVLALALSMVLLPQAEPVALGCIGLILLSFAIFVPVPRREHVMWLCMANGVVLGLVALVGPSTSWADVPFLLFASLLGSGLSLVANEIQLRRRRLIDRQLMAVRGLYARMKEHELDVRRQDEFLFMQQETLVVQQAELIRLNEELGSIARLDALTGLGNRLRLNEDLAQLAGRIERSGGTAGLLLMDLDRFKRLNDSMGHLAGDAALRGVSDVLRKTSRVGDGLYRYGGEEFLVILHDADQAVLEKAAQRFLSAIAAAGMPHPDNQPYGVVTASAGAVELSQANCLDVDSALHDADEALYLAKERGRNRLEVRGRRKSAKVVRIDQQRAAS
jgi:diguanylate cyclase (GGDEF)-like protein